MAAVTIGLPVYNGEKYLDEALASLSAQTFLDLEIIVSDNASTDRTSEIVAKWAARDPRIRYHRQPENVGATRNFQWVLENVKSDWFMFAAYDDKWSPNYVETLYAAITASPGLWMASAQVTAMREDGSLMGSKAFPEGVGRKKKLSAVRLSMKKVQSGWMYGLFAREAFARAWVTTQRYPHSWGSDMLLLLFFLYSGRITGDNRAVFYQRHTGVSNASYKPADFRRKWELFSDFWNEGYRLLQEADLSGLQKIVLLPSLVGYANRHAWKLRRLVRDAVKAIFLKV